MQNDLDFNYIAKPADHKKRGICYLKNEVLVKIKSVVTAICFIWRFK